MSKTMSDANDFEVHRDVVYATHDGMQLSGDLYLPKGAGAFPALVAVHGGGWRVDELTQQMGIENRRHRGVRITDERTLTVVEMALGDGALFIGDARLPGDGHGACDQ